MFTSEFTMPPKSDKIPELQHKLDVAKSKLTRFEQYLKSNLTKNDLKQLEFRLELTKVTFKEFDEIQTNLEYLSSDFCSTREEIENIFFNSISFAQTMSENFRTQLEPQVVESTASSQQITQNNDRIITKNAKLPELNLPVFEGTYEGWSSFYELFTSIIDENSELSDTQKFLYLKLSCKQDAQKVIESLNVTAANYQVALKLLRDRFENKRAVVARHVNDLLFKLPEVKKDSHNSLRNLLDTVFQHTTALNKLGLPTQHWDALLIPLIVHKLDYFTQREWENKMDNNLLPTLDSLTAFLSKKCTALETLHMSKPFDKTQNSCNTQNTKFKSQKLVQQAYLNTESVSCPSCKGNHYIHNCSNFIKLTQTEKYNELRKLRLCTNCLRSGHQKYDCKSGNCRKCSRKHNTLLHIDSQNSNDKKSVTEPKQDVNHNSPVSSEQILTTHNITNHSINKTKVQQVLLSTATILLPDQTGQLYKFTALLDGGSQSNFITERVCEILKLKRQNINIPISTINSCTTNIRFSTKSKIKSRITNFETELSFLIIPKITLPLPALPIKASSLNIPLGIHLADEQFDTPKEIDILIGASIFYDLLKPSKIALDTNSVKLHETEFGWILTGFLTTNYESKPQICNLITNEQLHKSLTKFWETEQVPQHKVLSDEEQYCENYFRETTTRDEEGRFIVRLPFKQNETKILGESQTNSVKRFQSLENRFKYNSELQREYSEILNEYEFLNHMSFKTTINDENVNDCLYFLPHHPVLKSTSTTTKCRIVFDASAKTSNGNSLNDILYSGPVVQDELFSIVLRWRLFRYVIGSDIKMMYRQIIVHPHDRQYQQIVWRNNEQQPIKIYELNRVTFGITCSPYLATRCLVELAHNYEKTNSKVSNILLDSFYVDDFLASFNSLSEVSDLIIELYNLLTSAGFELRKWITNDETIRKIIIKNIPDNEHLLLSNETIELKTLGIIWNSVTDNLHYSINVNLDSSNITKRFILSIISQIFDPMGLIGPILIHAKILIQQLWRLQFDWDSPIPNELAKKWIEFSNNLKGLKNFEIPRQVLITNPNFIEMHVFCDASEKAYGACIYIVSTNKSGEHFSRLLCAKSKVTPLKTLSLPRLELLAAHIGTKLSKYVIEALKLQLNCITYYTDSTIVLSWLKIETSRLKTYVANRISQILEISSVSQWQHVPSTQNPADIISRGTSISELANCPLWWQGPEFLIDKTYKTQPQDINIDLDNLSELKRVSVNISVQQVERNEIFTKYSSLKKLINVMGYILRFKNRTLHKIQYNTKILSVEERDTALLLLIKLKQLEMFPNEIKVLKQKLNLSTNNVLSNLNPFLCNDILRVGGRLENSSIPFQQKHPIILHNKHPLTILIIKNAHLKNLHAGIQTLSAIIRLNYWILHGKNTIKQVVRSCIVCFRNNPKTTPFLMGNLPKTRVEPNRPFLHTGVDYAGPINIKTSSLRTTKAIKSYICVFVDFSVRAIHLELAVDLTTEGFLNALKRFVARRGKPLTISSDNGSNFVGANNQFQELNFLKDKTHVDRVSEFLAQDNIQWKFIPPRSPHMGGIWESAVKSIKFHLRRIVGNSLLTYEELYTILVQIESILNSRPLTPLSSDPEDLTPLTPAHFLIGDSLAAVPQDNVMDLPQNRVSRYEYLQQVLQHFWKRWSREYLTQQQQRYKWKCKGETGIKIGDLVVLTEENTPPLKWPMARVVELHPGADNVLRTISVKMSNGAILKRTLAKVCLLPIDV